MALSKGVITINAILKILPADALIALVLLAGEIKLWIDSADAPPQAQLYPRILVGCAAVLTLAMFFRAFRGAGAKTATPFALNRQVVVLMLITLAYIIGINYLGYLLATVAFGILAMAYLGMRDKKILIGVPILVAVALYLMFTEVLFVVLPSGTLLELLGL